MSTEALLFIFFTLKKMRQARWHMPLIADQADSLGVPGQARIHNETQALFKFSKVGLKVAP